MIHQFQLLQMCAVIESAASLHPDDVMTLTYFTYYMPLMQRIQQLLATENSQNVDI